MQTFERLQALLENYQDLYPRTVSLELKANGSGHIKVDTSRGGDVGYTILMEWNNWKDLTKQLWAFRNDDLYAGKALGRADKDILEDCVPNSYYR